MPGYNCSIKDRMLYASAKNAVVETIEHFGVVIDKKVSWMKSNTYLQIYFCSFCKLVFISNTIQVEVDSGKELTEEFLHEELHPKKNLTESKFARPKPPGRAGNRRGGKAPASS